MKGCKQFFAIVLMLLMATAELQASDPKDVKGSEDHPLISRFPDTYISYFYRSDYDDFVVATDKFDFNTGEPLPPVYRGEGATNIIEYRAKSNEHSVVKIFRNYESAFNKLGLETLFACSGDDECGYKFIPQMYWYGNKKRQSHYRNFDGPNLTGRNARYYYWSGKGEINGQQYYVSLVVGQLFNLPAMVMLDINTVESLNSDQIAIDLDGLTKAIDNDGKIVLDGILFDTNKTIIKPESAEVIKTIASYLKANASKTFYVVGHTDSDGTYSFNVNLSSGRAAAVVSALAKEGVPSSQLQAVGVGPVNPVSKNNSSDNKAKNRRVELVEM